ncbi:siderophore ABC transporter substrate-binding protein [Caviibacterium pharyngocola]|uniref:ABC transporter n=1 Tax=Caviibacterium pharyngocola TaxID=28159 RepID=A0A2M8RWQ6_9PAST|nr:siderophore ABC transporter substrate-binding protein [Caviibacterium pharyngocola]PJG83325.1 ABC transporter [Caviibacterium pharyngocola]
MKKALSMLGLALIGGFCVASANAADITVENAAGKQVVPQNPQRVVVLDFSAVDTLRALGEKEKIVGVPNSIRVPQYLSEFAAEPYANVGTPPEPAFEKINELHPDLIIATGRQEKVLDRLKEIAPVFFIKIDYDNFYPSFQQNILAMGQIFAKENLAQEQLAQLDQRMTKLAALVKDKTALMTLVNESKMSAFGESSRYGIVYSGFGFTPIDKNIKSSTHGMSIGFEYILEKNPDYLLVVDRTAAITDKADNAKNVLDNAIIQQTDAYKANHIVYLNAANWYLTFGGLESMNTMVDEVQNAVSQ